MSDYFAEMLENKIDASLLEVQQSMVCVITKYDKSAMRADVQPLLAEEPVGNAAPVPFPLIANIPVNAVMSGKFYIRPAYDVGDKVWVSFATHEIDESLKDNTLEASKIVFDLASACVIGGVTGPNDTPPVEFGTEDGLLIGHKLGDAYLRFESDKVTAFFQGGSRKVEWSNGGMRFWNGINWTNFMTHKHTETGTVTTSPITGT